MILLVGGGTGTGKSTVADRGRVPARDHPRHLDRLRPPDDARVLREGVHALDPLLELRGGARADEGRGGGVGRRRAARLPRPDAQRPRGRRGRAPARARRGLVDGARGHPPRPGDVRRSSSTGALVIQCVLAIHDEEIHSTHFWHRDPSSDGVRPVDRYIAALPEIRMIQDYIVERARRCDVPVIENESRDGGVGAVMELVLERAERVAQRRRETERGRASAACARCSRARPSGPRSPARAGSVATTRTRPRTLRRGRCSRDSPSCRSTARS